MEQPRAPPARAAALTRAKPGISSERTGSATTSSRERPSSARSPSYRAATSAARFPHWRMASESFNSFLRMRRASAVCTSVCGCTTAAASPAGTGSRTTSSGS